MGFDRRELLAAFPLSVLSENLPFTTGFSALILTQTLTKDKGDHCFLWLIQVANLKHIDTPAKTMVPC